MVFKNNFYCVFLGLLSFSTNANAQVRIGGPEDVEAMPIPSMSIPPVTTPSYSFVPSSSGSPVASASRSRSPIPSASETPKQCIYGRLDVNFLGDNQKSYGNEAIFAGSKNISKLSCLNSLYQTLLSEGDEGKKKMGKPYRDDYIGGYAANIFSGFKCSVRGRYKHSLSGSLPPGVHWKNMCLAGHVFLKNNPLNPGQCIAVDDSSVDPKLLCGNIAVTWAKSSPISLAWGGDDIDSGVPIYGSLELSGEKSWLLWKASEDSPLLVYDPMQTGEVTSVSQLFGDWTFGGQVSSSISSLLSTTPRAWKNGFEALETLDQDKNGKVDGEELTKISLWFDKNRNGISEKGEVVLSKDSGLSALYYNIEKGSEGGLEKDLVLNLGYERVINGKTVSGKSVDWYSPKLNSASEVIQYKLASQMIPEVKNIDSSSTEYLKRNENDSLAGSWTWTLSDNNSDSGYFMIFSEKDKEHFSSYSITQKDSTKENLSLVTMLFLDGTKTINEDGTVSLTMESENIDGLKVRSSGTLSADGKTINGKSSVSSSSETPLEYDWVAIKN